MATKKRSSKKTTSTKRVRASKTSAAKRSSLPPGRVRISALPSSTDAEAEAEASHAHPGEYWSSPDGRARLISGDSLEVLAALPERSVDVIFADPPYFLSNGGTTCQAGKRVSVNKGKWDASMGAEDNHGFNLRWLEACQRLLTDDGTIWVSGTSHVIYSVGYAMQKLGFKMLNDVVWEKPNPPPNLSCRYFTHSTELVLWAAKTRKSKHYYDYPEMKQRNGNKQMKNVWRFPAPGKSEKSHGRHPTQKPLALLDRLLVASCPEGGRVLDPFNGSGTTGVAAVRLGHSYTGIERESEYLELSRSRLLAEVPEWGVEPARAVG
ncbi:site-specific DNA-methyltransferase [Pseudenhygromyxa sp. WMMC2535]|uniref:DNA-methyltransferase n=1 Tax=Pseudenhygromyxa sp. WMMC2535 TaxID=2712867 RepID=UPI0031F8180E